MKWAAQIIIFQVHFGWDSWTTPPSRQRDIGKPKHLAPKIKPLYTKPVQNGTHYKAGAFERARLGPWGQGHSWSVQQDLLMVRVGHMKHRHGLTLILVHLLQTLKTYSEAAVHHIQAPSNPIHLENHSKVELESLYPIILPTSMSMVLRVATIPWEGDSITHCMARSIVIIQRWQHTTMEGWNQPAWGKRGRVGKVQQSTQEGQGDQDSIPNQCLQNKRTKKEMWANSIIT